MARKTDKLAVAEFPLIDESLLKSRIYTIRGVKVMLDADLAGIYGYSTKAFNRQVKNNIDRFAEDFRFQLSKSEVDELRSKILTAITGANNTENLRCKNCTANLSTMSRSCPFVFTEQGIYMLMTVLKGDLAVQQSMALIRLFKQMKDYIVAENQLLLGNNGITEIAAQTIQNTRDIALLSNEMRENRDALQKVMENFVDSSSFRHFLILNGHKLDADVAYTQIYGMAKKSLLIVDNYVDVKTLNLLRNVRKGVSILIASDRYTRLTDDMLNDFRAAMPGVSIDKVSAAHKFHDRYILIDFKTKSEKLYHCGASSKDAGNKITTIVRLDDVDAYRDMFEELLSRLKRETIK